jgi:hypothetical protein
VEPILMTMRLGDFIILNTSNSVHFKAKMLEIARQY